MDPNRGSFAIAETRGGRRSAETIMTKSELIESLSRQQKHLAHKDVELAVKGLLEQMSSALASGRRIEVRGFGSFSLHYRPGRVGRNPKTGTPVSLPAKYVPHFKPGKELRERVDEAYAHQRAGARGAPAGASASGIMSGAAAADPAAAD